MSKSDFSLWNFFITLIAGLIVYYIGRLERKSEAKKSDINLLLVLINNKKTHGKRSEFPILSKSTYKFITPELEHEIREFLQKTYQSRTDSRIDKDYQKIYDKLKRL